MSRPTYTFIIFIVLMSGCKRNSEYPGFSKDKSGIYYMLTEIGENDEKAVPGDYVTADITYKTMGDSVFFDVRRKIVIGENSSSNKINRCFTMLAEKEKATFILNANEFFEKSLNQNTPKFLLPTENFKMDLKIIDIQTKEEYLTEKEAFLSWISDFEEYESTILRQYFEKEKLELPKSKEGFYKLTLKEGNTDSVHLGDTIILNYEGKFLNGRFFDSTIKRKEPFGFVYGTEWQVIEGLEDAIGNMTEGEKALFIFPSELAFGAEGSSTGIVPPYTSVIFEVELIEIR